MEQYRSTIFGQESLKFIANFLFLEQDLLSQQHDISKHSTTTDVGYRSPNTDISGTYSAFGKGRVNKATDFHCQVAKQ
ncbi:hypothetical protein AV530_008218 [Patagioenas fasciata monilis]|uniref:Uncharacterized protein n=1 Tax=Patagioenas fasciata monilis TaxID=372326 RepID=A0A1V4KV01_PATFA|nr:hypothetical protein AV530_008218 [Patagioenas fasciata monilis]